MIALRVDAERLGRPPKCSEWDRATNAHPERSTVSAMFGGWPQAVRAAGLDYALPSGRATPWTSAEVLDAIGEWDETYGAPPSLRDWSPALARHGGYDEIADHWEKSRPRWPHAGRVRQLFGRWNTAIEEAGFVPMPQGKKRSSPAGDNGEVWTAQSIIDAIQAWVSKHGRPPRYDEWVPASTDDARPSATTAQRVCGSWAAAIRAAGEEPRPNDLTIWTTVRRVLLADPGMTAYELARRVGSEPRAMHDTLRYHMSRGELERAGTGGPGDPYRYSSRPVAP